MANEVDTAANLGISVGSKIRALRKIRGISLQQMAQSTGMSYSYLSGLEMTSIPSPLQTSSAWPSISRWIWYIS